MRRELEHSVTTGNIYGERDKGGSRDQILDSLLSFVKKVSTQKLMPAAEDHKMQRSMIVYTFGKVFNDDDDDGSTR